MYNIIPLILICVSLLIIIVIVVRKFPALANMDAENIPSEKEARFKEQIVSGRIQKSMAKMKVRLGKIFGFFGVKISSFFQFLLRKLQEAKKNYSTDNSVLPPENKEKLISELFKKNEDLSDREDFEIKEQNLIKIIGLSPQNAEAFESLGILYFNNKKYDEAKQALVHVLKLSDHEDEEKQADIYYNLAAIYRDTGESSEALETIKMAAKLAFNNPRYLDALLEISIMNGDKISAQDAFEKLSAVNPENTKLAEFAEQIKELE